MTSYVFTMGVASALGSVRTVQSTPSVPGTYGDWAAMSRRTRRWCEPATILQQPP